MNRTNENDIDIDFFYTFLMIESFFCFGRLNAE